MGISRFVEMCGAALAICASVQCAESSEAASNDAGGGLSITPKRLHVLQADSEVQSLVFSTDRKVLLAAHDSGMIRTWSVADGRATTEFTIPDMKSVEAVFGPGDDTVLVHGQDPRATQPQPYPDRIELWELSPPRTVWRFIDGRELYAAELSPDGQTVAVGGGQLDIDIVVGSGSVVTLGARTGKPEGVYLGHSDLVTSLAFVPRDESKLVECSLDGTVTLWDLDTKESKAIYREPLLTFARLVLSRDGHWLVAVGGDRESSKYRQGILRICELETGKTLHSIRHGDFLHDPVLFPREDLVIVGASHNEYTYGDGQRTWSAVGEMAFWDLKTGESLGRIKVDKAIASAAVSPDGSVLAAGVGGDARTEDSAEIYVWDLTFAESTP